MVIPREGPGFRGAPLLVTHSLHFFTYSPRPHTFRASGNLAEAARMFGSLFGVQIRRRSDTGVVNLEAYWPAQLVGLDLEMSLVGLV